MLENKWDIDMNIVQKYIMLGSRPYFVVREPK